jgi:hypothetical protein
VCIRLCLFICLHIPPPVIFEAHETTLLCLCVPFFNFLVFYAVRVVSKESRQVVVSRTYCCYYSSHPWQVRSVTSGCRTHLHELLQTERVGTAGFEPQPEHRLSWLIFLSLEANAGITPPSDHTHFLPNPFQFIIHPSPYLSMLYTLDTDSVVKLIHSFIHSSMALQPFVGPRPIFQFRNPIHSR